ncbi:MULTISPECIES: hypothetical protein [Nonomuraea]|uniref:Uncharacterized protein n=1 Tax=Nonomuraea mangrovi TaxID=2316207 RepID=A0ABW4TBR6_9ACTN
MALIRPANGLSMSVWLPKTAIEAYGPASPEQEALNVILRRSVLPIYEPDQAEPNHGR